MIGTQSTHLESFGTWTIIWTIKPLYPAVSLVEESIARAERDGTRAETRIRLSPKRTSPFKSVGASVQPTTGSRGVRISSSNGSNAEQNTFWGKVELHWLPTPFACFPFTSPPVRHRVPPGSERALNAFEVQRMPRYLYLCGQASFLNTYLVKWVSA